MNLLSLVDQKGAQLSGKKITLFSYGSGSMATMCVSARVCACVPARVCTCCVSMCMLAMIECHEQKHLLPGWLSPLYFLSLPLRNSTTRNSNARFQVRGRPCDGPHKSRFSLAQIQSVVHLQQVWRGKAVHGCRMFYIKRLVLARPNGSYAHHELCRGAQKTNKLVCDFMLVLTPSFRFSPPLQLPASTTTAPGFSCGPAPDPTVSCP